MDIYLLHMIKAIITCLSQWYVINYCEYLKQNYNYANYFDTLVEYINIEYNH